ncbi:MAG: hypothetical protein JXR07_13730 [Reichenbachiella sp.]
MRNILIAFCLFFFFAQLTFAQTHYKSNGANDLQNICNDPSVCLYVELPPLIKYPQSGGEKTQWELHNMELAAKKTTGHFIATGDMVVLSKDTAAILSFEIFFFDKDDELIHTINVEEYEFYNELHHAEPIMVTEVLESEIATSVEYLTMKFNDTRLIPYYEMKTNCYYACKNHKLNEEKHIFKKAK